MLFEEDGDDPISQSDQEEGLATTAPNHSSWCLFMKGRFLGAGCFGRGGAGVRWLLRSMAMRLGQTKRTVSKASSVMGLHPTRIKRSGSSVLITYSVAMKLISHLSLIVLIRSLF